MKRSYGEIIAIVDNLEKKLLSTYSDFNFREYHPKPPVDLCPRCRIGRLRLIHGQYGPFTNTPSRCPSLTPYCITLFYP